MVAGSWIQTSLEQTRPGFRGAMAQLWAEPGQR